MKSLQFNWSHETPDNLTYNLYQNGEKVEENIATLNFTLIMEGQPLGEHSFYITAVDTSTKLESIPSEVVSVNFTLPRAPDGLSVSWIG